MHRQGPARQKGGAGEAEATGRNPTDRGKCGSKRHLLTDGRGVPLAVVLSGANRHDMKQLADLLDAQVYAAPPPGEERHLCLDRGYDYDQCREAAATRGYTPHIPPKASEARPLPPPEDPARHPPRRGVVEVGHSWFNRFRRLLARWEKKQANYLAFVQLAAILIVYRKLRHSRTLSG
jgi:putative transposase